MWSVSVGASPPAGNDASAPVYGGAEAAIQEEVRTENISRSGQLRHFSPDLSGEILRNRTACGQHQSQRAPARTEPRAEHRQTSSRSLLPLGGKTTVFESLSMTLRRRDRWTGSADVVRKPTQCFSVPGPCLPLQLFFSAYVMLNATGMGGSVAEVWVGGRR